MDDERYSRYLGSDQSSKKAATAFDDIKAKLGLGKLSNTSALLLVLAIVALCLMGLWSYSPAFRSMFTAADAESALTLVKADDEGVDADSAEAADSANVGAPDTIYIYVSGAVKQPDVYALDSDARAIDALNAAGGFRDSAATEALNLASPLEDGMQIHVLTKKEFEAQGSNISTSGSNQTSAGEAGDMSDGMVNLNTADSTQLQTLPGIGPVTAEKIVKDREINGPYSSLEDLMRISGIGPKRVEALEGIANVGR